MDGRKRWEVIQFSWDAVAAKQTSLFKSRQPVRNLKCGIIFKDTRGAFKRWTFMLQIIQHPVEHLAVARTDPTGLFRPFFDKTIARFWCHFKCSTQVCECLFWIDIIDKTNWSWNKYNHLPPSNSRAMCWGPAQSCDSKIDSNRKS